jgi:hypothetical protein
MDHSVSSGPWGIRLRDSEVLTQPPSAYGLHTDSFSDDSGKCPYLLDLWRGRLGRLRAGETPTPQIRTPPGSDDRRVVAETESSSPTTAPDGERDSSGVEDSDPATDLCFRRRNLPRLCRKLEAFATNDSPQGLQRLGFPTEYSNTLIFTVHTAMSCTRVSSSYKRSGQRARHPIVERPARGVSVPSTPQNQETLIGLRFAGA